MLLEGSIAEMIVKLEPSLCRKTHIQIEQYVKFRKVIYCTQQVALLFWRPLSDNLIEWGFKLHHYDKCEENKMINGKQCTIIGHIDDLKVLHIEIKW